MKIKAVCEYTGLTDRAIRFYVEKGLITPESITLNDRTYYEYGEEEVELLKIIVILRRSGFSIEEILRMKTNPKEIADTLKHRSEELSKEAQGVKEMARKLEEARRKRPEGFADIYDLAEEIRREELLEGKDDTAQEAAVRKLPELKLEFGKFDPETEEEKEKMYEEFLGKQYLKNKLSKPLKGVKRVLFVALIAFIMAGIYMMIPRSLASFLDWHSEDSERREIQVNYGEWDSTGTSVGEYIVTESIYYEGSEGFARVEELLETAKCSGFYQSIFPKRSYQARGGNESIVLDILWHTNAGWEYRRLYIYDNGRMAVAEGNGIRGFYLDWFGREDCQRIFDEIRDILEECESE